MTVFTFVIFIGYFLFMAAKWFLTIYFLLRATMFWGENSEIIIIDIDDSKALAEDSSEELRALHLQLLAQDYSYELGVRVFFPTISIGFNQSDSVIFKAPSDTTKKSVSLSLHQPLFDGGRTIFQRKVQKLDLYLNEYAYDKKREELLNQTWQLFYNILLVQEKRRLEHEFYLIALQQLAISQKERELGLSTEIDLIDTKIEIKKLESEIRKTKMDEEVLVYQFKNLCGVDREQPLQIDGSIDFSYAGMALDPSPDYWLGIALDRNIDIRRLQFEVAKSKEELNIAETTYIPTIGADFTFSLSGEGWPLYEPGFSFKLTFQFPFQQAPTKLSFDANTNLTNQRSMAAGFSSDILPDLNYLADRRLSLLKIQMANLQMESARENMRFTIEQFLKNYVFEIEGLRLQKETLRLLEKKLRVYREQLGIGELKRIDYLKAQNDYYKEEISIRENILNILAMERSFEQTLGLEPGELLQIALSSNQKTGVK